MGMLAAHTTQSKTNGQSDGRIRSYAPATGELLGEVPVMSQAEVRAAVTRARRAQESWASLPLDERVSRTLRFRNAIVEREEELSDLLSRETGKPIHEALLHELSPAALIATYFAGKAAEILAPRELPMMLMKQKRSTLHLSLIHI